MVDSGFRIADGLKIMQISASARASGCLAVLDNNSTGSIKKCQLKSYSILYGYTNKKHNNNINNKNYDNKTTSK